MINRVIINIFNVDGDACEDILLWNQHCRNTFNGLEYTSELIMTICSQLERIANYYDYTFVKTVKDDSLFVEVVKNGTV